MDFSHVNGGSRKSGKFVLVAALHVALGIMFVHGMNTRKLAVSHERDIDVTMPPPEHVEPPPVVEPPRINTDLQPRTIVVPQQEVVVEQPLVVDPPVTFERGDHPVVNPQPPGPGPATGDATTVAPPHPPAMHQAVLADANACSLPAYPKNALRNEESGTTTLALLVGLDGRVSSARVEHSSGYRELDRAAVEALSLCQFKPATSNGVPEAGWAKLAYVWKLD